MIQLKDCRFWQARPHSRATMLVCLCALLFVAGSREGEATVASQTIPAQQSKPDAAPVNQSGGKRSAEDQTPKNAADADLNCWASVARITYAYDGPPDGRLVSFECLNSNDKPVRIEVVTNALENGKIVTKDFGAIQMKVSGSGVGGISHFTGKQTIEAVQSSGQAMNNGMATYYMTPFQIRKIKRHLGWMAAASTVAEINAKDSEGETALIKAVLNKDLNKEVSLIAAHADVNVKDKEGETALSDAATVGCAECAKALIAAGAELNPVSKTLGKTPLMSAAEALEHGEEKRQYNQRYIDCMKILIAAGADVNVKTDNIVFPGTALIFAVQHRNLEAVQLLIAAHADINARDRFGRTALAYAKWDPPDPAMITVIEAAGGK
jgi:hypothetical protein